MEKSDLERCRATRIAARRALREAEGRLQEAERADPSSPSYAEILTARRADRQRAVEVEEDALLELENAEEEAREAVGEDDPLDPPESYPFNDIVAKLSHFQQRATYRAVGELMDWHPRFVRRRLRRREHIDNCFIVSAGTGEPSDYPPERIHPSIKRHPRVLRTGTELLRWLKEHPIPR